MDLKNLLLREKREKVGNGKEEKMGKGREERERKGWKRTKRTTPRVGRHPHVRNPENTPRPL